MKKFFAKVLPLNDIPNIAIFYTLTAVYNAWIMAGVWIFIWGTFMTKTQIGISDSITFAVGFLFELPSGVLADLMGRKKAIVIGNVLLTLGNLFIGLGSSFVSITIWYLIWTIGYALQSGATEALAYDTLKLTGQEKNWSEVIRTSTVIGKISSLISTSIGGLLFVVGFRLPYLVAALIGLVGVVASLYLREIKVQVAETWSFKTYWVQIKDGLMVLLKPQVSRLALISLTVLSVGYMYNWGILRPLTGERFGFTPTTYAFLLSAISLSVILSISLLKYVQTKISGEKLLLSISLIYGLMFFFTGFTHSLFTGGLLMIGLAILLTHTDILFSQFINEHTKSQHRATTLSAVALFTKMPYVFLALIVAKIAENNGLPQYTIIVGVFTIIVWILSTLSLKKL